MKDKTFYDPYPSFWLLILVFLKWLELKAQEKLNENESDKKEEL
jgi:hypothetical protein